MKRRIIALLLACTMLLSSGCSANVAIDENGKVTIDGVPVEEFAKEYGIVIGEQDGKKEEAKAGEEEVQEEGDSLVSEGGTPWIDSNLQSNIKDDMELSPKEDFHLYTNYDWLHDNKIPEGRRTQSTFTVVSDITDEKALVILEDDTLKGHDAELIQSYYDAIMDWEARDKAGLTPIMDTVKDIQGISSLEDLSEFICDKDRNRFVPVFIVITNITSYDDAESYITAIDNDDFLLGDAAEYQKRTEMGDRNYKAKKQLAKAMLTRLDYSEKESEEMFDRAIGLEGRIAEVSLTSADMMSPDFISRINNIYKSGEMDRFSETFPLKEAIKSYGYEDAASFLVAQPKVLDRINELYTEDGLDDIKAYMLVKYVISFSNMLDSEAYDAYVESRNTASGATGREKDEKVAFDLVRSMLTTPMDRAYLERYDASEKKEKIKKICEDVIAVYRDMLKSEDWLSDETKEKAVEKLDSMKINSVYPDKWLDYSKLDLKGLSLYECNVAICKFNEEEKLSHTNGKVDHDIWDMDILEANAFYDPQDNSINLILGLLDEPFYYDGISEEELLGGIGSVIGHEISHAFDTNGAQYDKDGNLADWWKEDDYKAFTDRAGKLIAYYDGMTAWEGQSIIGKNIQTEAIADMAGVKALLEIAKDMDDFDYDKFFKAYARIWHKLNTREFEYLMITQDVHPLAYLRTNVTLQQFDEFYETYDIKEGDNMYLAPEDRVAVW